VEARVVIHQRTFGFYQFANCKLFALCFTPQASFVIHIKIGKFKKKTFSE